MRRFSSTSDAMFRFHPAERLVGALARILEGEILLVEGDYQAAISAFEQAVVLEDALGYDEPEPLPFAARHWLGAALLEAERHADAERVYREELADHPNNGWSLYGLKLALEKQDRQDAEVDEQFEESWARSDTWITSSRF